MTETIVMFHQGAELYGSDYMFLMSVRSLARDHRIIVVLDSEGPLVDRLEAEEIAGIEIMPLAVLRRSALRNPLELVRYIGELFSAIGRVRRLLRRHHPEIVYVNTLGVLSPLLAGTGLPIRRVHHLHEIFTRPKLVFGGLYTMSELFSDEVICVSETVRENLARMSLRGGRRGRVIHNGVVRTEVAPEARKATGDEVCAAFTDPALPLIAYVARLHYWKGQEQFLDVVARMRARGTQVNVAFFGAPFVDYPTLQDELEARAAARGLTGHVRFFGFRDDSHALFATADLSIMGSVEPDPFPTVVLESMAQGCPVVAYAHGGTPEMIRDGHNGLLVAPGDRDGMGAAVARVLSDPDLRARLGSQARRDFDANYQFEAYMRRLGEAAEHW